MEAGRKRKEEGVEDEKRGAESKKLLTNCGKLTKESKFRRPVFLCNVLIYLLHRQYRLKKWDFLGANGKIINKMGFFGEFSLIL
ncbi:MAG: hypothetical protein K2J57_04615, partial [Bacteroidales bacterium]|nr:hypothetical protein [Bacteroidales bacterium]